MALHRILVVDDSPAVRETVGILLGGEFDVHAFGLDDYIAKGRHGPPPSLIIATRTAAGRDQPQPFPAGTPVLWIEGPGGSSAGSWFGPSIPRRFSPRELRRSVTELLAAPAAVSSGPAHAPRLQPPFIAADAARALAQALGTDLPLHLVGEPGTGKRAVARAVHAARAGGLFLSLSGAHFDAAVLKTPGRQGGTVFVDRVEQLGELGQQALLGALEPTGLLRMADGAGARLISAATSDLGDALDGGRLAPDLYYRMTMLTVRLAPLRERPDDIPALAQMLVGELAVLLARAPAALTDRALDRLANYLWFGNLAELEAVLARTVALCGDAVIDVDDLLFDGALLGPPRQNGAAPPREGRTPLGGRPLDLIINELAHEFKNPLVTIKTFAHQQRRAKSGGDVEQVARLTGDAVAQIDQTLENLLEFTRLETPVPQSIPLSAILNPVFGECAEALATRGVALEHPPAPPVTVRGDPHQLAYALTNLVRALTRDMTASSRLAVRYSAPALLSIELPNGSQPLASHLATLLDRPSDGSRDLPLGVAIANAVFERNGAQLTLTDDTPSTVTVRFTAADEEELVANNGTAPRPGR